jgi:hypothetical protein
LIDSFSLPPFSQIGVPKQALFNNYQLVYAHGLVLNEDNCYIDAFPRAAGFTVIIAVRFVFNSNLFLLIFFSL